MSTEEASEMQPMDITTTDETSDNDEFTEINPPTPRVNSKQQNLARGHQPSMNHRVIMEFWNCKFAIDPTKAKDGNIQNFLMIKVKEFLQQV